ncbi:MAG: hypothetical protein HKP61_11550 [Dactylosporangium sp.]|nr:YbjN domain-containing protein [Dactylosporangium sp.]NNJ61561.1 hypothetical protein [Dactylosporangium sp.]
MSDVAKAGEPRRAQSESGLFSDDSSIADLRAKVGEAWGEFARQLGEVIPELPTDTTLDITLDPTASGTGEAVYGVQLRLSADAVMGTAVGNADLPPAYRLDRAAVAGLVALGWSPPGVVAGSGEAFGVHRDLSDAIEVAAIVSRTLRDVYAVPHPAFLTYVARGHDSHTSVCTPSLGAARPLTVSDDGTGAERTPTDDEAEDLDGEDLAADADSLPLADRVVTVVARLLRIDPVALTIDQDGDIGIRAGSAMVFVRVRENPPLIDVFSPVLTEIQPTQKLYAKLSELTNRMPIGRLYCTEDTVWASVPVFGRNFQASHLMLAVQVMTGLADELDDRLAGEFGGRRFFGEADRPAEPESTERTGMYL